MSIHIDEIKTYDKFDELAMDVLSLASEILPNKFIYINSLSESKQVTLKIFKTNPLIRIHEGMTIDLEQGLCQRIDFESGTPLVYEDISKVTALDYLHITLKNANVNAYLGIPISLKSGERFGTLCAVHHEPSSFDQKSIELLQKVAKMFAYYLEIEHIAYKDLLTGLYNRQYLYKFFFKSKTQQGAFFYIDLDGFKQINDRFGHDIGDRILKEAGHKLKDFLNLLEDAYAVRLGGDEFIVHIPNQTDEQELSKYALRLVNLMQGWQFDIKETKLSASIGIAIYHEKQIYTLQNLLNDADEALYDAKRKGKNTYHFAGNNLKDGETNHE
jgi:diguanylate cyclase (GGDEF)-like protein